MNIEVRAVVGRGFNHRLVAGLRVTMTARA